MNNGVYGFGSSLVSSNPYGPYGVHGSSSLGLIQILLVAGGGAGNLRSGSIPGPGGGGGGFIEETIGIQINTSYVISVGAGGSYSGSVATRGGFSRFDNIVAVGGGGGIASGFASYQLGSSGGGISGTSTTRVPSVVSVQGFSGGISGSNAATGGGGGSGAQGGDGVAGEASGSGGSGRSSMITGLLVYYGGGGGGGSYSTGISPNAVGGLGGLGGGGNGTTTIAAVAGSTNTGGGGGGGGGPFPNGANGGSGVVILRWNSSQMKINIGAGLTYSTLSIGTDTVAIFTAGTDNVSWS